MSELNETQDLTTEQVRHIPNPTGKGGFGDNPENINYGGRSKNEQRISWWYEVFGLMSVEDLKNWHSDEPREVVLTDSRVIKKDLKNGYAELAYNSFMRARKLTKDMIEVTDRVEGKAKQSIKHEGDLNITMQMKKLESVVDDLLAEDTEDTETN